MNKERHEIHCPLHGKMMDYSWTYCPYCGEKTVKVIIPVEIVNYEENKRLKKKIVGLEQKISELLTENRKLQREIYDFEHADDEYDEYDERNGCKDILITG